MAQTMLRPAIFIIVQSLPQKHRITVTILHKECVPLPDT
jgi:hypothetical protein